MERDGAVEAFFFQMVQHVLTNQKTFLPKQRRAAVGLARDFFNPPHMSTAVSLVSLPFCLS